VDLTGKTAVVTGANSGIGLHTALELAAHGAHVVLGCRNRLRAERAVDQIMAVDRDTSLELLDLDLSSLGSVHEAADRLVAGHSRLDILVHNAGVMGTPPRVTEDGFELQTATNHLGPFALTGRLLDLLLSTRGARVVTVSSLMHRLGSTRRLGSLDRLGSPGRSNPWLTYGDTKLANLLFTYELERRFRAAGAPSPPAVTGAPARTPSAVTAIAVAAHPGWARTDLVANGPLLEGAGRRTVVGRIAGALGQSPATGALPSLYAATAPGVAGGDYFGPRGPGEMFGPPKKVRSNRRSHDPEAATRLWQLSEEATGVRFDFVTPGAPTSPPGRPGPLE
jgi:NAD(P)-dependent dehydrogenase (short-subunit alcohol dehydrogenase family)